MQGSNAESSLSGDGTSSRGTPSSSRGYNSRQDGAPAGQISNSLSLNQLQATLPGDQSPSQAPVMSNRQLVAQRLAERAAQREQIRRNIETRRFALAAADAECATSTKRARYSSPEEGEILSGSETYVSHPMDEVGAHNPSSKRQRVESMKPGENAWLQNVATNPLLSATSGEVPATGGATTVMKKSDIRATASTTELRGYDELKAPSATFARTADRETQIPLVSESVSDESSAPTIRQQFKPIGMIKTPCIVQVNEGKPVGSFKIQFGWNATLLLGGVDTNDPFI